MSALESFYTMFTGLYNNVTANDPPPNQANGPNRNPANDHKKGGAPPANGYPNGAGYQNQPPHAATPQGMRQNGQNGQPSGSPQMQQGAPQGGTRGMSPQPNMRNTDGDRNAPSNQSPMNHRNQGGWEPDKGGYGQDPMRDKGGYGQDPMRDKGGYGQDPMRDKGGYGQDPMRDKGGYGQDPMRDKGGYGQDPKGGYGQDAMRTPERRPGGYENGGGMSSTATPGLPPAYVADKEDLLDQHVAYYLRHHPDVHKRHHLVRKRPGVYELNGREVLVEWQYATEPGGQGHLVVLDGPLRQPFADYMEFSESNAEYDNQSIGQRSSLHMIPKDKRMSFGDQHKVYTRLEAMKVAKEQALVRETHADYVKEGRSAPNDLMDKYKKTLSQKLGPYRRSAPTPESPPAASSTQSPGPATNGPPHTAANVAKPSQPPTPAVPNPTNTAAAAPTPALAPRPATTAQPTAQPYGMQQPHSWAPPYQTSGTTTAIPQYGAPSALAPPQGLFQQNMGGHNSYRPPGIQYQAPMRY